MAAQALLLQALASPYVRVALFALAWLALSSIVVYVVGRYVHRWAARSATRLDDVVVEATRGPLLLWLLALGSLVALRAVPDMPARVDAAIAWAAPLVLILATALALSRLLVGAIQAYGGRIASLGTFAAFGTFVARLGVYGAALMLILDRLGVTITPLLTAFGLGGLAIALALQDTLGNFFAGLYVTMDKYVRAGDYVELDTGHKGYVVGRSWRTVRIRELANNIIVVPNSRLASSIVKNYHLPEKELAVLVDVSVAYDSDLDRVEHTTVEVAREVLGRVTGAVGTFEPFIRYHTFGDSGVGFSVILRGREFVDQYLLKHEFIKALHRRYAEDAIVIPFPVRTVHLRAEVEPARPPRGVQR